MLNLILAIASSALVSITMRFSETKVTRGSAQLCVNYIVCILAAWAGTGFSEPIPAGNGVPLALILGGINGLLYLGGFVMFQWSIAWNGLVLSSTFMKLGLLVCMLVSVVLFREAPGAVQWTGFFLAVAAIVLINYRPNGEKAGSKLGLILILLFGGLGDAMSKIFEELGNSHLADHFLLYTFAVALIACAVLTAKKKEGFPGKAEWTYGMLVGVPNFYSAKFLLASLKDIPGTIAYPVYSVATILVVTMTGVLLFKERLEKRQWIGLGMILVALILLNI